MVVTAILDIKTKKGIGKDLVVFLQNIKRVLNKSFFLLKKKTYTKHIILRNKAIQFCPVQRMT